MSLSPRRETYWSRTRIWIVRNFQISIVNTVIICKQCLQTASASGGLRPLTPYRIFAPGNVDPGAIAPPQLKFLAPHRRWVSVGVHVIRRLMGAFVWHNTANVTVILISRDISLSLSVSLPAANVNHRERWPPLIYDCILCRNNHRALFLTVYLAWLLLIRFHNWHVSKGKIRTTAAGHVY